MLRLLAVAVGLAASLACSPSCGTYVVSQTVATDYEGHDYNGTWKEVCGAQRGSTGVWDWWADGWSYLWFSPDAPGERSWMAIDLEIQVGLPLGGVVAGDVLEAELAGSAAINPGISLAYDQAALTSGTVEVLSVPAGDPCEIEDGPTYRLKWDLTFGGGAGPTYVLKGNDSVQFSTFTSDACGGW